MTATLTARIGDQTFAADLSLVSALDAMVYEQATGDPLDLKIAALVQAAPEADDEWRLIDRAVIKWLYVRQAVERDAALAPVLASVTFFEPPASEEAGATDAPGDN